jgi:alpha-tubulin suppressor-like RCC1 family protein
MGEVACVELKDGALRCWGDNTSGQIGNGTLFSAWSSTPVPALTDVASFAEGQWHTCAVLPDTTVACWGDNLYGELGNGAFSTDSASPSFVVDPINSLTGAQSVVAGAESTCTLMTDSTVECWGFNEFGDLGNNSTTNSSTPVQVLGSPAAQPQVLSSVTKLSAAADHKCALMTNGTVSCWGDNRFDQVGISNPSFVLVATPVAGVDNAADIATGWEHTCVLLTNGTVECWGDNTGNQLGASSVAISPTPVTVSGFSGQVTALAAGAWYTCALMADGSIECWGMIPSNHLGTAPVAYPVAVSGLPAPASAIHAGFTNACALLNNQTVWCWGDNQSGELGGGLATAGTTFSATPVEVQ